MRKQVDVPELLARQEVATPTYPRLAHAIVTSRIRDLGGLPYPLQFRNQDALPKWREAMLGTSSWNFWSDPGASCHDVRSDIRWHIDCIAETIADPAMAENWLQNTRLAPLECSTNLVYALRKGMLIEATPALDSLLLNSDIDRELPLSMLALPYPAQYIRFGDDVARAIKLPDCPDPGNKFDGVFCFRTPPSSGPDGYPFCRLEFVFIAVAGGRYLGHISLLGKVENEDMPVMAWLTGILAHDPGMLSAGNTASIRSALDYVAKLLLYLGLKNARIAERDEYSAGLERLKGVGTKKHSRHSHRLARRYDRIEVGPERLDIPEATGGVGAGVAPHWRRGHFRLQPCGQGRQERKTIYILPVLVHGRELSDAPQPKDYRISIPANTMRTNRPSAAVAPANHKLMEAENG